MARLSYYTPQSNGGNSNNPNNTNNNQVGFFQLKNDGDTAIVRIMHDSIEDFDLLSVHTLQMGNKYRKVNCLRNNPYEPLENCPFCNANKPVSGRFFVHMLQYTKDAQGNVTVKPVIWDRAKSQFAPKLKSLIEEYGPLSQRLFKVKRTGVAGATNTTYDLIPCDKDMYNDAGYPPVPNAFNGYDVLGSVVLNKTAQEMVNYLQTNNFTNNSNTQPTQQNYYNQQYANTQTAQQPTNQNYPAWNAPQQQPNQPRNYNTPPVQEGAPNRPNRYY